MDETIILFPGEEFYCSGHCVTNVTIYDNYNNIIDTEGQLWLTNYRYIIRSTNTKEISRPLSIISSISKTGKIDKLLERFSIYCYDLSIDIIGFSLKPKNHKNIWKTLQKQIIPKLSEKLFCFLKPLSLYKTNGWEIFNLNDEFKRQGLDLSYWKISDANQKYYLCTSYPQTFYIPKNMEDHSLFELVQLREQGRIQLLTWCSNNSYLLRASALKEVNTSTSFGNSIKANDKYFSDLLSLLKKDKFLIYDINTTEEISPLLQNTFNSENCNIIPLCLPNKEDIKESFDKLKVVTSQAFKPFYLSTWREKIKKTKWQSHVYSIIIAATMISVSLSSNELILLQGHNNDNIVSIVSALTQILIDPYYRTIKGFCVLIEKEFMYFGYSYTNTISKKKIIDPYYSCFIIFLDTIWQLIQHFPLYFQFNEYLLSKIEYSLFSNEFGTFISSCYKDRNIYEKKTCSLWSHIYDNENEYINSYYKETNILLPSIISEDALPIRNYYFTKNFTRYKLIKASKHMFVVSTKVLDSIELESYKIPILPRISHYNLENVKHINLTKNYLTCIPIDLIQLKSLETLILCNNQISYIEKGFLEEFGSNIKLKILDLSSNQIYKIPNTINTFTELISLKLNHNMLYNIPSLEKLINLKELCIMSNRIDNIPEHIYKLSNIETLNIGTNPISHLNNFNVFPELQVLNISNIQINSIPEGLCSIQTLNISGLLLNDIPYEQLLDYNLKELSLGGLQLAKIPSIISKFKTLTFLDLSNNSIRNISNYILELSNLIMLNLSYNKLEIIPVDISNLSNLITLHLEYNSLSSLTAGIGCLENLRYLNVSNNNISHIPGSIGQLDKLKEAKNFIFNNNPLISPPPDVIKLGNDRIFTYLSTLLDGFQQLCRMKISIVGDSKTGKTCIANRLNIIPVCSTPRKKSNMNSDDIDTDPSPTFGIDTCASQFTLTLKDTTAEICIWDFSGHEKYSLIQQFYFRTRALYIIVWNISVSVELSKLDQWLDIIQNTAPSAPILLIGTHTDYSICTHQFVKDVLQSVRKNYINKYTNVFSAHAISCKSSDGYDEIFSKIESILKDQPFIAEQVPKSFIEMEVLIHAEKSIRNPPILDYDTFNRFSNICKINDPNPIASWLYETGSILYYPVDKELSKDSIIIIDIQWFSDLVSNIITPNHTHIKNGTLNHIDIPNIWKLPKFQPENHKLFLKLLELFELGIYLPSTKEKRDDGMEIYTGKTIIPLLLTVSKPKLEKWNEYSSNNPQIGRHYKLSSLPNDLFSKLFVRISKIYEPSIYWKNGLLLEYNEKYINNTNIVINSYFMALININIDDESIIVSISGANNIAYILYDIITNLLSEIYPDISYKALVNFFEYENGKSLLLLPVEQCKKSLFYDRIIKTDYDMISTDKITKFLYPLYLIPYNIIEIKKLEEIKDKTLSFGLLNNNPVIIKDLSSYLSISSKNIETEIIIENGIREKIRMIHPFIIKTYGITKDPYCIILEDLQKGSLYNLIHNSKEKELSWDYIWRCALDIAKIIKYMNDSFRPSIMKEFNTDCIFINSNNSKDEIILKMNIDLINMFPSQIEAKYSYPPEVIQGKEYTKESHIYTYGIILYELATRKHYNFDDENFLSQIQDKIIQGERPSIPDSIPKEYKKILETSWKSNPEERPTINDIINDIENYIKTNNNSHNNE